MKCPQCGLRDNIMDIEAYLTTHDDTLRYHCKYYHDPNNWNNCPSEIKEALSEEQWTDYIKYLDEDGNLSPELDHLPKDQGGIYVFFIQGQTLPFTEMYLAYVGRAQSTDAQNIRKRVKEYLRNSSKKNARPKIARLFKYWKDFLYVKIFSTKDNDLIIRGESALINSILPPFNSDMPESISYKEPVSAF